MSATSARVISFPLKEALWTELVSLGYWSPGDADPKAAGARLAAFERAAEGKGIFPDRSIASIRAQITERRAELCERARWVLATYGDK